SPHRFSYILRKKQSHDVCTENRIRKVKQRPCQDRQSKIQPDRAAGLFFQTGHLTFLSIISDCGFRVCRRFFMECRLSPALANGRAGGAVFLSSDPKRRLFLSSVGKTMIKLSFHQIINRARAEPMMQARHNKNSRTNRRGSPFFNYALLVYSSTSASTSSVSAHSTADSASCSMSVFLRLEICLRAFNTDD